MYRKPKFLATSVFAVITIMYGNVACDAVVIGTEILRVIKYPNVPNIKDSHTEWVIKWIAIAVITVPCLLHGVWRAGGVWLQNALAVVKVTTLWFFIIAGLAAYSGKMSGVDNPGQELSYSSSFDRSHAFDVTYGGHGWITAFLDVTFSYSGYEAANCKQKIIPIPIVRLWEMVCGS